MYLFYGSALGRLPLAHQTVFDALFFLLPQIGVEVFDQKGVAVDKAKLLADVDRLAIDGVGLLAVEVGGLAGGVPLAFQAQGAGAHVGHCRQVKGFADGIVADDSRGLVGHAHHLPLMLHFKKTFAKQHAVDRADLDQGGRLFFVHPHPDFDLEFTYVAGQQVVDLVGRHINGPGIALLGLAKVAYAGQDEDK